MFDMGLKCGVCHRCYIRDKGNTTTPFLMSADNDMDPGDIPAYLPELTQIEEIIARCHVQMSVRKYRGQQYKYTGHCVSFMQNTVKTVSVLPSLPADLDIVIIRPTDEQLRLNPRYQQQFGIEFRVRRGAVLEWLQFLKRYHPDYRWITIDEERLSSLPLDEDISASFPSIVDDEQGEDSQDPGPELATEEAQQEPCARSMVPNLQDGSTEVDMILNGITGRVPVPSGLRLPSIRRTPIDEAAGRERIFAMAFPTLYPTGKADLNACRLRKVGIEDYARHMLCYRDGRFGRHPRWKFLVFNILMRTRAKGSARFYVSRRSTLHGLDRDELTEALLNDANLAKHIARQGVCLTGTRPFWRSKSTGLQAISRFLSPQMSPVFITFSAADMQWHDLQRHFPGFSNISGAMEHLRFRWNFNSLQGNPHIVAHWLEIRFRRFIECVLKPYLGWEDYWYRYEWQSRGSGHLHYLFWIPWSPPLRVDSLEARQEIARYWGSKITAWNTNRYRRPDAQNPCSLPFGKVANTLDMFTSFITRVQLHAALSFPKCLRKVKGKDTMECRHWFP
jgi:hypothetical protein